MISDSYVTFTDFFRYKKKDFHVTIAIHPVVSETSCIVLEKELACGFRFMPSAREVNLK